MAIILKSHKSPYEKKIALYNCLKNIEVGELEPIEKERIDYLLQSKLYGELAKQKKTVAPPRIQKGSFFDKIVNEENRQECHLCKNCINSGKGNEPLKDEPTTEKCDKCGKNPKSGETGKNENKNVDPADSFCSDDCQIKNEKKQEEQRPFCIKCKKNKICRQHPELCSQCLENPNDNEDAPNEYPCERYQTSTYDKEKNSYIRRRITHYYTDFTKKQADQLTQIEMFSPELDVPKSVRELERQLEESKKKSPNQRHPNEIPHQENQISYLLNLHQNTQRRAEQAYQNRYGTLSEDGSDNNKNKGGLGGGMIALIVIGILVTIVYFVLALVVMPVLWFFSQNLVWLFIPQKVENIQKALEVVRYLHIGVGVLGLAFLGLGV
ncbi:20226_t:CDS:2 [Gigaspora margarita]|uniref:20226_t:CDS:1 n=1 Tax=Gigaspora margarita TaxID=4874 RepID=A0ABN7W8R8_GIGMA|nr:20226_t:CDS:2 [Gigaspora margarita]